MRSKFHLLLVCAAALAAGCSRSSEDAASAQMAAAATAPEPGPSAAATESATSRPEVSPSLAPASQTEAASGGDGGVSFATAQTADTDAWYASPDGASACQETPSPAQTLQGLRALGAAPTTVDTNDGEGNLMEVAIAWTDEHGPRSTTYFRKKGDCDTAMASAGEVPEKYRR